MGALVLAARALAIPWLGLSGEEALWDHVFGRMRAREGWCGLWTEGAGSYRPLCATYLELQAAMDLSTASMHALSLLLHLACLGLFAALIGRLAGRRAGWLTLGIASAYSSYGEVTSWLGARCELWWVLFALLTAHAMRRAELSSERRGRWTVLACVTAILSAASKENAFLLPLALAPLGPPRRLASLPLRAVTLTLAGAFAVRWIVLGDPFGDYAKANLSLGPGHFVRQLARAMYRMTWGEAPAMHIAGLIGTAVLVTVVGGALLWRGRSHLRWCVPWALAFLAVFAPSMVKSAPRTLYAPTLVLAAGVAIALTRIRWTRSAVWTGGVIIFVTAHAVGAIVSLVGWTGAYEERARAERHLQALSRRSERLYIVAPRETFRGHRLQHPGARDPGMDSWRVLCPPRFDPLSARTPVSGVLAVGHPLVVRSRPDGDLALDVSGLDCDPRRLPAWLKLDDDSLIVDQTAQPADTGLVFVDVEGGLVRLEGSAVVRHPESQR